MFSTAARSSALAVACDSEGDANARTTSTTPSPISMSSTPIPRDWVFVGCNMMLDFPCLVKNPVRHLIEGRSPEDRQSFAGVQRLWVVINQASQLAFTQESEHRSICCRRTTEPTGL